MAHTGPVHCVACTPSSIWTAGRDGMVHEFNLEDLNAPENTINLNAQTRARAAHGDFIFGHNQHNPSFRARDTQAVSYGDPSNPRPKSRSRSGGGSGGSGGGGADSSAGAV